MTKQLKNIDFENAWVDTTNNDDRFIYRITDTSIDRHSNLTKGMFLTFLSKLKNFNFNEAKCFFLEKINNTLSDSIYIEVELTEKQFISLESVRNMTFNEIKDLEKK